MMMPSSGTACLMARQAAQTRLSGLSASEPVSSRPRRVGVGKERHRGDAEARPLSPPRRQRTIDRERARRRASSATGWRPARRRPGRSARSGRRRSASFRAPAGATSRCGGCGACGARRGSRPCRAWSRIGGEGRAFAGHGILPWLDGAPSISLRRPGRPKRQGAACYAAGEDSSTGIRAVRPTTSERRTPRQ